MRSVTPKPESRVRWPGPGQEPCPDHPTRLATTRAPRNGPSDSLFAPTGTTLRRRHAPCFKRPRGAPAAPLSTIPPRSPSWSTTSRAMDLRSTRVSLFSQHGPSAVRVPSVSRLPPPRCSSGRPEHIGGSSRSQPDTPTAPLKIFGMPCSMASSRQQPGAVNRPFNTATHHTRRKPAQRRYALSRPVLLKATGRARAPLNRCRAEARPDGVTNACPTSRLHGSGHPARPGLRPGRFGPRAGP